MVPLEHSPQSDSGFLRMMLVIAFAAGVLAGALIFWLAARLRDGDTASLAQEPAQWSFATWLQSVTATCGPRAPAGGG